MAEIDFVRYGIVKGQKVSVYVFSGSTLNTYEIITAWGTTIQKKFHKSPYYFATLSPIASWRKM